MGTRSRSATETVVAKLVGAVFFLGILGLVGWAEWLIITGHPNAGETFERVWGGACYAVLGLVGLAGLVGIFVDPSQVLGGQEDGSGRGIEFDPGDVDSDGAD
jgi:hypothetical protein